MKLKKTLAFLILIFISISEIHARILEQTFEDSAAGFTITAPEDWQMKARSTAPGPIRATIKFESPVDQFTPNVVVRVSLLPKEAMTLENFILSEKETLGKNLKMLEEKEIPKKADHWPTGYQWKLEDTKLGIIFLQRLFVIGGKSYVLIATAKKSTWSRFEKDFEMIFEFFKLKNFPKEITE